MFPVFSGIQVQVEELGFGKKESSDPPQAD
jgi:hypothetical protein